MTSTFRPLELGAALMAAAGLEVGLYLLFTVHVELRTLRTNEATERKEIPIAVTPVLDDVPLLKLGSKVKARLPDIWRKPTPQKRYEDKSAPAPNAKKEIETPPTNEVAKADETPAPEDAELAKKVDDDTPPEDEKKDEPNLAEEGAADGVKEGTEVDPLKAYVIDQYRIKIIGWFKAGFTVPSDSIDCATLNGLKVSITAQVGADRTVVAYTVRGPSGNSIFDSRVQSHMDRKVGRQLPPPPPKYPDILDSVVNLLFSGKTPKCKNSNPPSTAPKTDSPEPDTEADSPAPTPEPDSPAPVPEPSPPPPSPEAVE